MQSKSFSLLLNTFIEPCTELILQNFCESYLSSRTQCVSFTNALSECSIVTAGYGLGNEFGTFIGTDRIPPEVPSIDLREVNRYHISVPERTFTGVS